MGVEMKGFSAKSSARLQNDRGGQVMAEGPSTSVCCEVPSVCATLDTCPHSRHLWPEPGRCLKKFFAAQFVVPPASSTGQQLPQVPPSATSGKQLIRAFKSVSSVIKQQKRLGCIACSGSS